MERTYEEVNKNNVNGVRLAIDRRFTKVKTKPNTNLAMGPYPWIDRIHPWSNVLGFCIITKFQ
jgi:hypothetical protein